MAESLDNTISENASGPAKASGDGTSMEQHPLPDQIAADKYLSGKDAVKKPGRGLLWSKINHGSPV
jgi:hypothetical protein